MSLLRGDVGSLSVINREGCLQGSTVDLRYLRLFGAKILFLLLGLVKLGDVCFASATLSLDVPWFSTIMAGDRGVISDHSVFWIAVSLEYAVDVIRRYLFDIINISDIAVFVTC